MKPTRIPSALRARAHRAMALAALRSDSSLSNRLRRYNHHMEKARTLQAHASRVESVALQFHTLERDDFRVVGHTGSQKAFRVFFYVDPVNRTGAIAALNTVGWDEERPDTEALRDELRAQLFEDVFPLFDPQ